MKPDLFPQFQSPYWMQKTYAFAWNQLQTDLTKQIWLQVNPGVVHLQWEMKTDYPENQRVEVG